MQQDEEFSRMITPWSGLRNAIQPASARGVTSPSHATISWWSTGSINTIQRLFNYIDDNALINQLLAPPFVGHGVDTAAKRTCQCCQLLAELSGQSSIKILTDLDTDIFCSLILNFMATLVGLSLKELVTLGGGQINADKFSCRLILKGNRQSAFLSLCQLIHARITRPSRLCSVSTIESIPCWCKGKVRQSELEFLNSLWGLGIEEE